MLEANLAWSNSSVLDPRSVTDITTLTGGAMLELSKQVRNLTEHSAFSIKTEAAPGQVLEYCIQYQNIGTEVLSSADISDPIPYFTQFLLDAYDSGSGDQTISWYNGVTTSLLSAADDSDAGDVSSGFIRVQIGNVEAAELGKVCYQVSVN
jgi:uncharacterized repeat protein (TIGR01451 family)